ncbi:MAG: transglutaminase family protein [Bacteroidota bacterium]|nr:transglutaminase family protein [Bacteroidota bacterium]
MKLNISHKTVYKYENPVELNPHSIFLKPLQRSYYNVEHYNLQISPSPAGLVERSSIEGNPFFQTWFSGMCETLEIITSFRVLVLPFNPFSFIIDLEFIKNINPNGEKFFQYDSKEEVLLYPFLRTSQDTSIQEFANYYFSQHSDNPLGYLMALTAAVNAQWHHIIRIEDNLWGPEFTFHKREGSCRDLSWMLIHMLRMQGLATRFVSGYAYNQELDEGNELHAWVEAYLPGAGWVGLDPSLGLFTDQNYIPCACSSDAQNTLPLHGSYAGEGAAFLTTHVAIRRF